MARSCRLFTSWSLASGVGSGVAVGALGMRRALEENGWDAGIISPSYSSTGYLRVTLRRLFFNFTLRNDPRLNGKTPLVCFDFDGFFLDKKSRFASINGGLLGDIIKFESGLIQKAVGFMAKLEKHASEKADRIFTPSEYAKKTLCALYGVPNSKVTVMHHGIFFDEWLKKIQNAPLEPSRPPTVLTVARLYKRKGIDSLIEAWPEVLAKVPEAKLRIAGDGLEYINLVSKAEDAGLSDSIKFEGHVTNDELSALFANCDIFCLPSRHETFGLVFLEAMAAGKPVVALNSTATPELVRDGIDGFLAEPEDIAGLSERIISLMKDGAMRDRMGCEASRRVKKKYGWQNVITPLVEWMEEGNAG